MCHSSSKYYGRNYAEYNAGLRYHHRMPKYCIKSHVLLAGKAIDVIGQLMARNTVECYSWRARSHTITVRPMTHRALRSLNQQQTLQRMCVNHVPHSFPIRHQSRLMLVADYRSTVGTRQYVILTWSYITVLALKWISIEMMFLDYFWRSIYCKLMAVPINKFDLVRKRLTSVFWVVLRHSFFFSIINNIE